MNRNKYIVRIIRSIFFLTALFCASGICQADIINIESKIDNGPWKSVYSVSALKGQEVLLRVRRMEGAEVKWYQIIPDISVRYNNAEWPWMPNAYRWKGFDAVRYQKEELKEYSNKWKIKIRPQGKITQTRTHPIIHNNSIMSYLKRRFFSAEDFTKGDFYSSDLGSFWYQAEIKKGDVIYKTPGIESRDKRGISPKVFRISVQKGNGFMGNLTSYFNVPAIFGSTPYQVDNYIGVDCADVLMAAYYRSKKLPVTKDYNVAMLTRKFPVIARTKIRNGVPDARLKWDKDIHEGDFIAVKYKGGRQYQHIGALFEDSNANRILDENDVIIHAGPDPLHLSYLRTGEFNGSVIILRPD